MIIRALSNIGEPKHSSPLRESSGTPPLPPRQDSGNETDTKREQEIRLSPEEDLTKSNEKETEIETEQDCIAFPEDESSEIKQKEEESKDDDEPKLRRKSQDNRKSRRTSMDRRSRQSAEILRKSLVSIEEDKENMFSPSPLQSKMKVKPILSTDTFDMLINKSSKVKSPTNNFYSVSLADSMDNMDCERGRRRSFGVDLNTSANTHPTPFLNSSSIYKKSTESVDKPKLDLFNLPNEPTSPHRATYPNDNALDWTENFPIATN